MTRSLVSCPSSANLHDCTKKMAKERVDSILIIDKKKLLGILTARDILWVLTKKPSTELKKIKATAIAKKKIAVIKPSADLTQALQKMQQTNFRRLPVLSKGEVIGVITFKDIVKIEPSLYSEITNFIDVREEERKLLPMKSYPLEGFCENCNAFSELLKVEGQVLCPDCREELH